MYQALYRKWRPMTFGDVVGQEHITQTLKTQLAAGKTAHAYLFTGTRGTGKTTCAKILARAVNCTELKDGEPCNSCRSCEGILSESILDVSEIDAATNNGVDNIRSIRDETSYTPASVKKRVYIIDEVHMLSAGAFNALLKTLEEPPEHVMFILATTEVHKLPATILSRCQRFDFRRIPQHTIASKLMQIAQAEQIGLTEDGAATIATLGDGSMRDSLSLLERCAMSAGAIGAEDVNRILGIAGSEYIYKIAGAVAERNLTDAILHFNRCYADGAEINSMFSEMTSLLRDLLIIKLGNSDVSDLISPKYDAQVLNSLAQTLDSGRIVMLLDKIAEARERIRMSADKRLEAELCLLALCAEDKIRNECIAEQQTSAESFKQPPRQTKAFRDEKAKDLKAVNRQTISYDVPPWEQAEAVEPEKNQPGPASVQTQSEPAQNAEEKRGNADVSGKLPYSEWGRLLAELKKTLSLPVYTHLSLCEAYADGQTLVIYMEDDMTAMMVDKPAVREQIAAAMRTVSSNITDVKMVAAWQKNDLAVQENKNQALKKLLQTAENSGIKVDIT